jgi:hypothetical protein
MPGRAPGGSWRKRPAEATADALDAARSNPSRLIEGAQHDGGGLPRRDHIDGRCRLQQPGDLGIAKRVLEQAPRVGMMERSLEDRVEIQAKSRRGIGQ